MLKRFLPKSGIDYLKPSISVLFVIFIAIKVPVFFSLNNLISVLSQGAVIGIASIGMAMVILAGEIDISVGAIVYCTGVIASELYLSTGSLVISAVAAIGCGGLCGLINGIGVAKLKIPSLITTLAVCNILSGLGSILIGSEGTLSAGEGYKVVAQTKILGLLSSAWIYIILFLLLY